MVVVQLVLGITLCPQEPVVPQQPSKPLIVRTVEQSKYLFCLWQHLELVTVLLFLIQLISLALLHK